jgi:Flp pilus assembly protein TadG
MTTTVFRLVPSRARQRGSSAVELALIALVALVPLLFGVVQVGLAFFSLNFATEVTRYVARHAVVCDKSGAQQETIKSHVIGLLPMVFRDASTVTIEYGQPAACIVALGVTTPCVTVTVTPGVHVPNFIPFVPVEWNLPPLRTTLTPESFASSIDGTANPVCQ